MSARARTALLLAALGAALALGCTVALAATARHASRSERRSHVSSCAHRARGRAHRARRCRAKSHRKLTTTPAPASQKTAGSASPAGQTPPPASVQPASPLSAALIPSTPQTGDEASKDGESEPPSIPFVQVSAVEYSFSLSRTSVPAGEVVLQFVNDGQDEHNLHLETAHEAVAQSLPNTPSKGIGELHLIMRPGSYTLFCSLPMHEQKGMKATLTVE